MREVNAGNWGFPPYNRWSFQHVQNLFPTARLRRGDGSISSFGAAPRDFGDMVYVGRDGLEHRVEQLLEETYTDAFLVLQNGDILSEQYFNHMQADRHHLLNSVSKSFLGILTGIVVGQGLLDPESRVVDHLPEFRKGPFAATRVQDLLDMRAAVEFSEDYANPADDFWVETAVVGWRPGLVGDGSAQTLLGYAESLERSCQPDGGRFHYRTVLTNVLGMVLERVTERCLEELLEEELWSSLGAEQDAVVVVDSVGFPYIGAGMNACARDLARFGQMIAQQGMIDGRQVVPRSWIDDTRYGNDSVRDAFAQSEHAITMPGAHYRNKFWVTDRVRGVMSAIGIHGQQIYIDMTAQVVIVKLSSQPEPLDQGMFLEAAIAMEAIAVSLDNA